ncbi:hypothetical protein [Marinobacter salarius]|uniref:hypothetical protein n=1 Tax=Marinobacter salarius TaxID=1420917 RepID=UPI003D0D6310
MNNTPALVLFIATTLFGALYLGAKKDVAERDQVIAEMHRLMSAEQKAELKSRYEAKLFVLDSRQ